MKIHLAFLLYHDIRFDSYQSNLFLFNSYIQSINGFQKFARINLINQNKNPGYTVYIRDNFAGSYVYTKGFEDYSTTQIILAGNCQMSYPEQLTSNLKYMLTWITKAASRRRL